MPDPLFETFLTSWGLNGLHQKGCHILVKNWIFDDPFHQKLPVFVILVPVMIRPSESGSFLRKLNLDCIRTTWQLDCIVYARQLFDNRNYQTTRWHLHDDSLAVTKGEYGSKKLKEQPSIIHVHIEHWWLQFISSVEYVCSDPLNFCSWILDINPSLSRLPMNNL